MLINDRYNVYKLALVTGRRFLVLLATSAAVGLGAERLGMHGLLFPTGLVAIFVAAVSIFLAFRINVGYARWWQANQVWGGLVNECRSLGMYVVAMLLAGDEPTGDERERHRRVVYRQIGFVNALRLQLRRQGPRDWAAEIWDRRINGRALFTADEAAWLKSADNIATQIVTLQARDIASYFEDKSDRRHVKFVLLLRAILACQGQAERIKDTVLAWGYSYYTKMLTRLLAGIVVLSQLNSADPASIVLVSVIATVFLTIEHVGRHLDNPFEGSFNDAPMTTLCRTVEIDLLEQIGEPCDLEPVKPAKGQQD